MGLSVTEYIFSSFLPLVLRAVINMCDCHSHCFLRFILFHDCLAQGQLVSAHCVISFMCVVTKKGFSLRLSLLSVILLTCCQYLSRRQRISQFLWVLVLCLLCSRHVRSTQKEQNNNHKVVAELVVSEEEDLVVRKVPLIWYCSKFDNTDD